MAFVGDIDWSSIGENRRKYLKTFNELYSIRVDSIHIDAEFIVGHNRKNQLGFETYTSTDTLSSGKHMLNILRKRIVNGDTSQVYLRTIPFWYFED